MFEADKIFLGIFATLITAVWIVAMFVRERQTFAAQRNEAITDRVIDIDKLLIEHPDIQKYLSDKVGESEEYFRSPEVLKDPVFYKTKSLAYLYINWFDQLLVSAMQAKSGPPLLAPPLVIEQDDWEEYIREKIRHPLFRSILNNEQHIFGETLRNFWAKHKPGRDAPAPTPYMW